MIFPEELGNVAVCMAERHHASYSVNPLSTHIVVGYSITPSDYVASNGRMINGELEGYSEEICRGLPEAVPRHPPGVTEKTTMKLPDL
jgi:hypothetical protein